MATVRAPAQWRDEAEHDEANRVYRWRLQAAIDAGLDLLDAQRFADGHQDTHQLTRAAKAGATPTQLAGIFL